jgi:hypothetical protein
MLKLLTLILAASAVLAAAGPISHRPLISPTNPLRARVVQDNEDIPELYKAGNPRMIVENGSHLSAIAYRDQDNSTGVLVVYRITEEAKNTTTIATAVTMDRGETWEYLSDVHFEHVEDNYDNDGQILQWPSAVQLPSGEIYVAYLQTSSYPAVNATPAFVTNRVGLHLSTDFGSSWEALAVRKTTQSSLLAF